MDWKRTLQLVDVHCAGEIGRVLTGGVLNVPGDTMAAKLYHINTTDDSLRRLLTSEPRSGPAGSVVLLLPATRPEADIGMIILQPDQAHAMSGSNAMCAVTALLETGMVEMHEPVSIVTLDTASGLVRATARCENGKVVRVSLDMPPAFVARQAATILTDDWGEITYDLCFGGVFYALIDVDQIGLSIAPQNARALAAAGVRLCDQIASEVEISHPDIPEIEGVAYAMFRADQSDGTIRTCTILKPGRVDRSPCGTGSNANMAVKYAMGLVKIGDILCSQSIIGGEFFAALNSVQKVGPFEATCSSISGQSWIYGFSQIVLDPSDPFQAGFTLSDTWGSE